MLLLNRDTYRVTQTLSTIRLGKHVDLIKISTVLLSKNNTNTREKGLCIYAKNMLSFDTMPELDLTFRLTEEEIQNTIDATWPTGSFFVSWGKRPRVSLSINNYSERATILYSQNLLFPASFQAKPEPTTKKEIRNAFEVLKSADASIAVEI